MSRQPPVGTQIDWNNSLTNGLALCYPFFQGHLNNIGKLVTGPAIPGVNAEWSINPVTGLLGFGATDGSTSNQHIEIDDGTLGPMGWQEVTVAFSGYIHGLGGGEPGTMIPIGDRAEAAPYTTVNWDDGVGVGSLSDEQGLYGASDLPLADFASIPAHRTIAWAADSGWVDVGIKGPDMQDFFVGNTSGAGGKDTHTPNASCRLGEGRQDSNREVFGSWNWCYVWSRKLSVSELRSVILNPYQIFKKRQVLIPMFPYVPVDIVVEGSSGDQLSITLVDAVGTQLSNLTNLSWSWFDESSIDSANAPTASGTGETTDGAGLLEIDITGTSLGVGQTGTLALMDSSGYIYALYKVTL